MVFIKKVQDSKLVKGFAMHGVTRAFATSRQTAQVGLFSS
jgi:hypothetical protein